MSVPGLSDLLELQPVHLMPVQPRVLGVMIVREQKHYWIRGVLTIDPTVVVEFTFEEGIAKFPSTNLTYIGLWQGKKNLFEFQNGTLCCKPRPEVWDMLARPLIDKLIGYSPMRVVLPSYR